MGSRCMDIKTITERDIVELFANGMIDFIDAGCGNGGSLEYCIKRFGFPNGLGFDWNREKIHEAQLKGYMACALDIQNIDIPFKCVKYSSMMDFIEHLPNMETAERILLILGNASKDFLFIRHPNFDDIEYLRKYRLKMTWTDWTGHPNMMTISDYVNVFNNYNWKNYRIIPKNRISNSDHESIIPIDAPRDIVRYSQLKGFKKEFIEFDKPVYAQYHIFIKMNDEMSADEWDSTTSKAI
jgi:hypothetical protein